MSTPADEAAPAKPIMAVRIGNHEFRVEYERHGFTLIPALAYSVNGSSVQRDDFLALVKVACMVDGEWGLSQTLKLDPVTVLRRAIEFDKVSEAATPTGPLLTFDEACERAERTGKWPPNVAPGTASADPTPGIPR